MTNLFELLAESVLFFSPAVWWISRQAAPGTRSKLRCASRGHRAGGRRTLGDMRAHWPAWLSRNLEESFAATPAFADAKDRPGLRDRVRRVLAPGARPQLRLTWRALAGSLVLGGAVFLLSALGTQWTVQAAARLLTPQERIERIETAMTDFGQPPDGSVNNSTNEITIQVRTADGSPLPRLRYLYSHIQTGNSGSGGMTQLDSNGVGKVVLQGSSTAYLGTWVGGARRRAWADQRFRHKCGAPSGAGAGTRIRTLHSGAGSGLRETRPRGRVVLHIRFFESQHLRGTPPSGDRR